MTSAIGFKTMVDHILVHVCCLHADGFLRFPSNTTPADLSAASVTVESLLPTFVKSVGDKGYLALE